MKKIISFFVLVLLVFGLNQKIYSQECSVDLEVVNECGQAALSVVGCQTCSYMWRSCNDTTCLSTEQTFYTTVGGCYSVFVTGNNTGCSTELGYYLEISEPCDTITEDTTVCCTNCDVSLDIAYGCGEATLTMTIDSLNQNCDYQFFWSNGATTQNITITISGNYKYRVISDNCDSGWKTVWVQIKPSPTVWISGKDKVCQGTTTTLTAMSSGTTSSYKWNNGATASAINAGTGTFKVTVTDMNGCEAFATKVVTEYPTPTVTISGKTEVCKDNKTELTASSSSCGSCFRWSTGETTKTIKVGKGIYTVTVTDPVTCCTATATVTVTEVVVQIPDVYASLGDDSSSVILASFGSYKSVWSTGEIGQTITVYLPGVYSVQGMDVNGCLSDSSCPIPVFASKDSVGTSGITLDTVICDTLIVHDTITVYDTLYYEDLIGGCHPGGLYTTNPVIKYGDTIPIINHTIVKLHAPPGVKSEDIISWDDVPSSKLAVDIETLKYGSYSYYLKCKIKGKEVCLEFSYTVSKNGGTTPTNELETRTEPSVWPNPTRGELNIEGLPPDLYFIKIINKNGHEMKTLKIVMQ